MAFLTAKPWVFTTINALYTITTAGRAFSPVILGRDLPTRELSVIPCLSANDMPHAPIHIHKKASNYHPHYN
jgi:hypothetical protein